jgi:hypothetical protein
VEANIEPAGKIIAMTDAYARAAADILMFAVVPVWLLAGLTDYFCHRYSHIERTSGPRESALHLIQLALVGLPVTLTLFLEVDAALFAIWIGCLALHHVVAFVDVRYANHTRVVTPFEQMVHSFLELTPIMAFILLAVLFWPQLVALFGQGPSPPVWTLTLKSHPLPALYSLSVLAGAALLNVFPYLEELIRTLRATTASAEQTHQ